MHSIKKTYVNSKKNSVFSKFFYKVSHTIIIANWFFCDNYSKAKEKSLYFPTNQWFKNYLKTCSAVNFQEFKSLLNAHMDVWIISWIFYVS